MCEILRNVSGRKLGTGLTVFGIVVGIFALTVMGSLTEYFNVLIANARQNAGQTITVTPKGGFRAVLSDADVKRIERVQGVKAAVAAVTTLLQAEGSVSFGPPDVVLRVAPVQIVLIWENADV